MLNSLVDKIHPEKKVFLRFLFDNEFFLCCFLSVVTFAVFSPACCYPLLNGWDDHVFVTNAAPRLTMTFSNAAYWLAHARLGCYLPITMWSYMLDYWLWGLGGGGYHLQNIIWHIIAVLGVFKCFRRFRINHYYAFFGALFFAIHPQRVESVAWVSERKDVMCAAFYFWCIYFYFKSDKFNKWYYLSFIFFVFSFLSKPMAASLPCTLFLLNYIEKKKLEIKHQFMRLFPLVLIVVSLAPLTYMAQVQMKAVATNRIGTLRQLFVVAYNTVWYGAATFFPRTLSPIYPRVSFTPNTTVVLIAVYTVLISSAIYLYTRKRNVFMRKVVPLTGCYFTAILPVVGLIPFAFIDYADRYSYIPSFFLLLGLGFFFEWLRSSHFLNRFSEKKNIIAGSLLAAALSYLLLFSAIDYYYIKSWKNIYSLHKMALLHSPPNNEAVKFLADILSSTHAEWMTKEDVDLNQLKSDYIKGVIAYNMVDMQAAFSFFMRIREAYSKLATIPGNERVVADYKTMLLLLASIYDRSRQTGKATECYEELLRYLDVHDRDGLFYRGVVLMRKKQYSRAEYYFNRALKLDPEDDDVIRHLRFCVEHNKINSPNTKNYMNQK